MNDEKPWDKCVKIRLKRAAGVNTSAKRDRKRSQGLQVPEDTFKSISICGCPAYTDGRGYFVSESSVYRILKAQDLITSPAYVVIKASEEFHTKTTAINQLWQTDFTYFKRIGWGWVYLSTILDDYSRYVVSWRLCTTMKAQDVMDTIDDALAASGCDKPTLLHKPRLLSDNGSDLSP